MPRKPTANGRRELLVARVSEQESRAVKQVCGESQSAWVRNAVLAALADEGITVEVIPEPVKPERERVPSRVGPDGLLPDRRKVLPPLPHRPLGAGVFREPGGEETTTPIPPAPAKNRTRCMHRGIRHIGSGLGTCPECKHRVEAGGLWAPECDAGTCGH